MRDVPWGSVGKALALVVALGFVFSVQFIPHLATFEDPPDGDEPALVQLGDAMTNWIRGEREGYPWAIHVDEHLHMSIVSQVQRHDRVIDGGPYVEEPGEHSPFTSLKGAIHERGYHIVIAQAEELTGVSTYRFYQFLPALWTTFIAFAVWALIRPHPAALPAAAFVGLIPSTARFLGTGYLVPIGFSLAWIPATAILTEPSKKRFAAAILALAVTTWAFFLHLVAGFACVAIFAASAIFSTGQGRSTSWKMLLVSLLPVAVLFRAFWGGVQGAVQREERLPIDFTVFDNYGLITLGIWALGVAWLFLDPPEEDQRASSLAFGSLSLVGLGLIVSTVVFDLNKYAMYTRMHMVFFLTAAMPAGFAVASLGRYTYRGLARFSSWLATRWPRARYGRIAAVGLGVAVAIVPTAVATNQAVGFHLDEGIYRVMSDRTWSQYNYVAATENEPGSPYEVFLSHPWQSPFLFEKTGKIPHAIMYPGSPPVNGEDWEDYLRGNKDLAFFVDNDITLVIGPHRPGEGFHERGDDIWLMEEPYAEQIQRLRDGKSLQLDRLPAEQ